MRVNLSNGPTKTGKKKTVKKKQINEKLKKKKKTSKAGLMVIACNDITEELDGLRQLLRRLALPLGGKALNGVILQVNADGRELHELALDLEPSHSYSTSARPNDNQIRN